MFLHLPLYLQHLTHVLHLLQLLLLLLNDLALKLAAQQHQVRCHPACLTAQKHVAACCHARPRQRCC
jgi:hypothetical protein